MNNAHNRNIDHIKTDNTNIERIFGTIRMKLVLTIALAATVFGQGIAQIQFYVSPDVYGKMSISSDDPFYFETEVYNNSPYFNYETTNFSFVFPLNVGISAGLILNKRHEFVFGINSDGSSVKSKFQFETYEPEFDHMPNRFLSKTKHDYTRCYFNYKYAVIYSEKKTNLSVLIGLGMVQRAGPKFGNEPTGGFTNEAVLDEYGTMIIKSDMGFTFNKRGWLLNFGISSDLYFKKKYWFSTSLVYTYSPFTPGRERNIVTISNPNTGYHKVWTHNIYLKGSGLYLGISRKFQLIPWKKRNKVSS